MWSDRSRKFGEGDSDALGGVRVAGEFVVSARFVEPGPDTPVVLPQFVVAIHADLNARYGDAAWSLGPLTANPSTSKPVINWSNCPTGLADELRLATWTMINGELRPTFMQARGSRLRSRSSTSPTYGMVLMWMQLATWLQAQGVQSLADCGSGVLHAYGQHLLSTHTHRDDTRRMLGAVTRLWAFDQLSAKPAGIGRPPWDVRGADDYLVPLVKPVRPMLPGRIR
jgi:hypothetical protein